ncbi:PAS domain-containing sensor histidine kinase [Roseateles koreensis]|uniref:PAS domain S-box protein n=1 Tax=Roseateles koreensis TaxID=2987526 RepID=A0ABT5KN21_9BURK|nr:PAS domain S-box protein [Roseateles koreensis]MDC8784284.1 PAS domain S-box protein [Roseateles koreensis]
MSPLSQLSLLPQDLVAMQGLLSLISDPVFLLGEELELLEANPSALALLQQGKPLHALQTSHGGRLGDWLRLASRALLEGRRGPPAPGLKLDGGQRTTLNLLPCQPHDKQPVCWLLHLKMEDKARVSMGKRTGKPPQEPAARTSPPSAQNTVSPEVTRDEPASSPQQHQQPHQAPQPPHPHPGSDAALREQVLREQIERSQAELGHWLALSPLPMVLFDETGLLLRSNTAFAELCLEQPVTLQQADPALQVLLSWAQKHPSEALRHARNCIQTQASLIDPTGRTRWFTGRIQALDAASSSRSLPRRFMAILEDRSSDQERDLAYQQMDALMDTASVGLATFAQDAGWLRPRSSKSAKGQADSRRNTLTGLQGVGRDMVEPASLPEFERLQRALKKGDRVEVRYAVRHPELGRRWLLTRVEPGQLNSGQRTTSVVTLDVTAQAQAENRSEQLLHELRTIMDGAGLGLAYFRGDKLQRCNHGFEQMLGLTEAMPAGTTVAQMFGALPELSDQVQKALEQLEELQTFDAEFLQVGSEAMTPRWLSLSLRRVHPQEATSDASTRPTRSETIAVISDISRLKTQQAELEALVQDREMMFSLSDVGIAILRDGRIARANDALAALTGYRINELGGLAHAELFEDPQEFKHHNDLVQADLQRQGLWRGERRVRRRDGSMLWMQISKRVMRPGAPDEGLIATFVNVDDRWRAQQSLMLQTERERAVLDSVLVGIVTVGRGGIEWMNRSARRMFGADLSEFAGQPMSMVATPDPDHPFRQTHYLDELTEGETEAFECRLKARDGREFWVVGNAVVTGSRSSGRQLTYALLDIDRRRQAEAQTQQAQASLSRIIEAAPLAISLHDAKSLQVVQINQAAATLAGRHEAELLGATPEDLFGREQGEVIRRDMLEALQAGAVTQREYRLGSDEQIRVWDARFLHLAGTTDGADANADGAPEQLLLVASDVTEHRAAEEARLQAAISQRELLVREVHHRIKNNLQGVAGLLQQIAARRPEVAPVISEAVGQVHAIAQVYGLQVGSSGPLMVRRVMEAIIGSVQRMSGRQINTQVEGETAEQSYAWALPEAESIPIALTLNELLTNAIKHSPNSNVQCTLICERDHVAVEIINPGHLPPDFNLALVPGGVSGLGLVRALLPRRTAVLTLSQRDDHVVCRVDLYPPSVSLNNAP